MITHELWFSRLRDRVRALATWAVVMRLRQRREARRRAVGRWQKALEGWRRARAETEEEADQPPLEAGERRSERLREVHVMRYDETRRNKARPTRQRRAVAAVWSARVGLRLWWWMERGEGWDARGPGSVTHGRSRRVDGDG